MRACRDDNRATDKALPADLRKRHSTAAVRVLPKCAYATKIRSRDEMECARVDASLLLEGTTGAETHIAIKLLNSNARSHNCRTSASQLIHPLEQGTRDSLHERAKHAYRGDEFMERAPTTITRNFPPQRRPQRHNRFETLK